MRPATIIYQLQPYEVNRDLFWKLLKEFYRSYGCEASVIVFGRDLLASVMKWSRDDMSCYDLDSTPKELMGMRCIIGPDGQISLSDNAIIRFRKLGRDNTTTIANSFEDPAQTRRYAAPGVFISQQRGPGGR